MKCCKEQPFSFWVVHQIDAALLSLKTGINKKKLSKFLKLKYRYKTKF